MAQRRRPLRGLVLAIDALLMMAAMAIALGLHSLARGHLDLVKEPPPFREYAPVVFVTVPWFLLLIAKLDLHRTFERVWSTSELVVDIVKLHALGLVSTAAAAFVMNVVINRSLVGLFLASTFVLLLSERLLLLRWRRFQHQTGQGRTRLLLVGDGTDDLGRFAQARSREALPAEVIGYLGEARDQGPLPARLGSIDDLDAVLHEHAVDLVLFFPPWSNPRDAVAALSACEALGTPAAFAIELVQPASAPPRLLDIYDRPFVSFEVAAKSPVALAVKHALDVVAAAALLVLLAIPLLVIAAAILLTMGRPVLFGQERVGLYGRRFRMWKFRTMVRGAESMRDGLLAQNMMSGPVFKLASDPRVTRIGRLLRRTSLDELPQLFNVLTGSMSLVGPRPLPIAEQAQIRGGQRRRLSMKPGITGLWQVAGRNLVDFDDWMKLELRYIDEWSLALDLTILLRTVPAVLSSRGAR